MEFCEQIKKFAELELEREHKEVVETLRAKSSEERLLILGTAVLRMMQITVELDKLESDLNQQENTYECLREVYADEGENIDDIEVRFLIEGEEDEL